MKQRWVIAASNRGWHVRDLERAFAKRGVTCDVAPFSALEGGLNGLDRAFDGADGILVRTIPAGTLEQVVLRMDLLHLATEQGISVTTAPGRWKGAWTNF